MNRVKRNRADWEKLIREHETSGESAAGFCRARGLSESVFGYWRQKLRSGSKREVFARVTTDELVGVELPGGKVIRVSRQDLPLVVEALCGR